MKFILQEKKHLEFIGTILDFLSENKMSIV